MIKKLLNDVGVQQQSNITKQSQESNNQNEIYNIANIFDANKNTAADNSKFDAVINFFSQQSNITKQSQESNNQNEINTVANVFETYKAAVDNFNYDTAINFFSFNTDDDIKKDDTKAKDDKETSIDENKGEAIRDIQQTIISQYKSLLAESNTNLSLDEFIAGSLTPMNL